MTRTVLPPGPASLIGASATHVLLDRTHAGECRTGPTGDESCPLRFEVWAGRLGGPPAPLTPGSGCVDAYLMPRAGLDRHLAVAVEYRGRCVRASERYAVVRFDLASGARRTIAVMAGEPWAAKVAGDWVAWWRPLQPGGSEIAVWRAGRVRRRVRSGQLGAQQIDAWDLQADGIVVAAARPGRGRSGRLFVARPTGRGALRPLGVRITPFTLSIQAARGRIAAFAKDGRLIAVDLAGRSRAVRGRPGPQDALADFDGRRGAWLRQKTLVEPTYCPFSYPDPPQEPCEAKPGRFRNWIVGDVIAR